MNAGATHTPAGEGDEPSVVGLRVRPFWSIVLYALLVSAAGLALYAQRSPTVDPTLARVAPWIFLVFAVGFAVYRLALVAARRYSPFKAFIQVFLAALFFLLLLSPVALPGGQADDSLLTHHDPRVRALAAEVVGLRNELSGAPRLVRALRDVDPSVREAAHQALVKLNQGADLGGADEAGQKAWETRFP